MKESLRGLPSVEVKAKMQRVDHSEFYTDYVAASLGETVLGQPEATQAVARRIAIFESGFNDPTRPLGSIYELGPSGTGKTEMAHALSKYMFNDPNSDRLKIINMGEFQEGHTAMRFVGAPPSYVGFNEKPEIAHDWLHAGRSVILFDEVEKAHPTIHRMLLSILDKGKVNARNGQEGVQPLDFTQSFIFFTSNVGGVEIQEITDGRGKLGFGGGQREETKERDIERVALGELKKHFAPEFIKRLDEVVTFKPLEGREVFEGIFWKFVSERNARLQENLQSSAPYFAATTEFRDYVISKGGGDARKIRAILEQEMFARAANAFMEVDLTGKPIVADYDDEEKKVVFYTDTEKPTPPPSSGDMPQNVIPFDRSLLQQ